MKTVPEPVSFSYWVRPIPRYHFCTPLYISATIPLEHHGHGSHVGPTASVTRIAAAVQLANNRPAHLEGLGTLAEHDTHRRGHVQHCAAGIFQLAVYLTREEEGGDPAAIHIAVALAVVPRYLKRDYAERLTLRSEPARNQIAREIATKLAAAFEIRRRPPQIGQP
jgi:hypothetical protein